MGAPFDKDAYHPLDTFAFEALSVGTTAVGFTAATFGPSTGTPAILADFVVESGAIRYRTDGTDPTAATGTPVEVGQQFTVWGTMDIRSFRAIRRDGVSATLSTHFAR